MTAPYANDHQFLPSTIEAAEEFVIVAKNNREYYERVRNWFNAGNTTVSTTFPYRNGNIDNEYLRLLRSLPQGKDRARFAMLCRKLLWKNYAGRYGQDPNHGDAKVLVYGSVASPLLLKETRSILDKAIAEVDGLDGKRTPNNILKQALREIECPSLKLNGIYSEDAPRIEEAINDLQEEVSVLDDISIGTGNDLRKILTRMDTIENAIAQIQDRMDFEVEVSKIHAEEDSFLQRMQLDMDTHSDAIQPLTSEDLKYFISEMQEHSAVNSESISDFVENSYSPHKEIENMSQIHSLAHTATATVTLIHGREEDSYTDSELEALVFRAQDKKANLERMVKTGSKSAIAQDKQLDADIKVYVGIMDKRFEASEKAKTEAK